MFVTIKSNAGKAFGLGWIEIIEQVVIIFKTASNFLRGSFFYVYSLIFFVERA